MVKTFDIKIDIEKDIYSPMQIQFEVSNSDDSVELNFEFVQDETPFDLTGSTVQLAVSNPSNQVYYQDIMVETPVEGKASVQLSNQGFQQAGLHVSEIYIRDVDTIVTSPFYFKSRASIIQGEIVPTDPTDPPIIPIGDGTITWNNVLNKPSFFPPEIHSHLISDVTGLQLALDSKANVGETGGGGITLPIGIADVTNLSTVLGSKADINHTHPEYLTSIPPEYLTSIPAEYLTETEGDLRYQASGTIPEHTHPEYLTDVPPEYLTQIEGDASYQPKGTYLTDIPAEYLTEVEGDARYQASGSIPAHDHEIADVTGLQTALDGKMDDGDAYLKTQTYSKGEVYNRTEIDQLTMGAGGGSPVIVEDNLMSVSTTNALSSNQGRILDETKADINHTHPEYLTDIPADYLTQTEGDTLYQAKGSYLTEIPADYLTQTEGDGLYQPKGSYLTDVPPEYLTQTEGDTLYQAKGTYLTDIPAEYLTQSEGDARYQATGTVSAHDHAIADVTGLQTELDGKADVNHNHDNQYSPIVHSHSIGDITGLSTTLDGKADVNHTHDEYALVDHTHPEYLTAVPPEYLTATEGDALYQPIGTIPEHTHPEYLTDIPAEYLTELEGDLRYQASGNYLTAVPPEYLTETEGDLRYQPAGNYLTDVPPEYLTQSEGDTLYQPKGTYLTSIPAEYLTQTEGDTLYQAKGTYLTDIPAEYLTTAEGDALYTKIGHKHDDLYSPIGHNHTISQVTGLQTALDGKVDDSEMTTKADVNHTHDFDSITGKPLAYPSIAHFHAIADVNGLQTALDSKITSTYADAGDNYIMNTRMAGLTLWKGTQAQYDALTPSATTLYFIVG
jgi:hypothetical protein